MDGTGIAETRDGNEQGMEHAVATIDIAFIETEC
jgi:hypothetical protein